MSKTEQKTPRALRPHIVLTGRCNAGKSSLLNALVDHDLAIVSPERGTTTDPVRRSCELVPFGPVVFVDTAGTDDPGVLATARAKKASEAISGSDVVIYVMRPDNASEEDAAAITALEKTGMAVLPVFSHCDLPDGDEPRFPLVHLRGAHHCSSITGEGIAELRETLITILRSQHARRKSLLADLVKPFRLIMLIVPIDLEAPAGRLILPQVQTIREVLDADAATVVVKEREVSWMMGRLKDPPDLVITDSQVVLKAAGSVPAHIPLTTFSILFSRYKGDLDLFVRNARRVDELVDGSRVLITETCSHHTHCDDIGRVKIPRWLRQYTGKRLEIEHGTGLPDDISRYDLIIHCGACMITRTQMLARIQQAQSVNAPITNYGVVISHLHGLLDRVLHPFHQAQDVAAS